MVAHKKKQLRSKAKLAKRWHPNYLNSSFMLASIVGFLVSYYLIFDVTRNFGFAFMLLFIIMFIASIVSMTSAPIPKNPSRY